MAVQAALDSDIALVFDECTPFHVDARVHRALDRAHAPLASSAAWTGTREHGPAGQLVYGIVQGGVYEDLRDVSAAAVAGSACDGIAIGGSLGQRQGADVRGRGVDDRPVLPDEHARATCSASATSTT